MLPALTNILADPQTGERLRFDETAGVVASASHSWSVLSPGYLDFTSGMYPAGDDAGMVANREVFLARGNYGPFVEAVTDAVHEALGESTLDPGKDVSTDSGPIIVDLGAGTGYYLAHTLDDVDGSSGIGIDISHPAAGHLAECHPRAISLCCDVTRKLPIADHSVDVVTIVFAVHNPEECARILKPGGQLIVLTAVRGHLSQLREKIGLADLPGGEVERLNEQVGEFFTEVATPTTLEFPISLDQESIATQVGMSPSTRFIDPFVLAQRVAALPKHMTVTAKATVSRFTPKG